MSALKKRAQLGGSGAIGVPLLPCAAARHRQLPLAHAHTATPPPPPPPPPPKHLPAQAPPPPPSPAGAHLLCGKHPEERDDDGQATARRHVGAYHAAADGAGFARLDAR